MFVSSQTSYTCSHEMVVRNNAGNGQKASILTFRYLHIKTSFLRRIFTSAYHHIYTFAHQIRLTKMRFGTKTNFS